MFTPLSAGFQHPTQSLQNSAVSSTNFSEIFPQPPSRVEAATRRGNGQKTGPKGVLWTTSKERKLSRLHSLTTANINDIPIILKGDRPNPLRPINEVQSLARVETSFNLKMHLKMLSQKLGSSSGSNDRAPTPALLSQCNPDDCSRPSTSIDFEALFADYAIPTPIPSFKNTFDGFANKEIGTGLLSPVSHTSKGGRRSSFASLQSLERRMADRVPQQGKPLTPYTSEDLRSFLFVTRKLSVETIASKYSDFTVSSLNSYAGPRSSGEEGLSCSEKTREQSEPTTGDVPHHLPEETQVRITLSRANECCNVLNRGDPPASRSATCGELLWLARAGVNIHARNAADQTFLHVVNTQGWETSEKSGLATRIEEFRSLLLYLLQHDFDFRSADHYGQTPLHLLTRHQIHSTYIKSWFEITQMTAETKPLNRDFQGRTVDDQLEMQSCPQRVTYEDPYRHLVLTAFILSTNLARSSNELPPTSNNFLASSTNVLHIHNKCRSLIQLALSGFPDAEYQGLNALHCLARSCRTYGLGIINQTLGSTEAPDLPSSESILKRKLAQRGLLTRHDYIIKVVKNLCVANVDVNSYDLNGFTTLMAFVQWELSCIPADRKTNSEVLTTLINNGANVHLRNRRGRTALHIAMRLGRVGAVETLLANHANVHATTNNRHGVLDLAGKALVRAQNDPALCARLTACIGIAVKYGAVVSPDTKLDWVNQIKCREKGQPTSKSKAVSKT
ncbi:hypothetical protein BGZ60DRAFT_547106 [Tricladium varicosporioides]|nr:hypothetical protein BGZ60DRAFT_547106 [Hymenoscyphus varicosporioides]